MQNRSEVIVIGGGLAGLVAALELSRAGVEVLVIEKKGYPAHKVCGEYVSNEVRVFLESLGLRIKELGAAEISRLEVSAPSGYVLKAPLDMGGFGVSRFRLEESLYRLCLASGVRFLLHTTVSQVEQTGSQVFRVGTSPGEYYESRWVIGAYGKKSNLDLKLRRRFTDKEAPYMAVKYHVRHDHPRDTIYLHNFEDGYCGMSAIEEGKSCLCYLTRRSNLKKNGGNLADLENRVLRKNPYLNAIFSKAEFLYEKPLVINGFSFHAKSTLDRGIMMAGDAAGLIPPLCGNGMAMAVHSAHLLAQHIIGKDPDPQTYQRLWNRHFSTRLTMGRALQLSFGNSWLTESVLRLIGNSDRIARKIIHLTHGGEIQT